MKVAIRGLLTVPVVPAALCVAVPAAAVIHDVPGDYAAIQLAIWAAAPGDTVRVAPGNYMETISMADGVLVMSSGGPEVTTIDGDWDGPVVTFNGVADAVLEGFTVTDAFVEDGIPGAGIRALNSTGRLTANVITWNSNVYHGGGVALMGSEFLIENNGVSFNFSTGNGAGIYVADGSAVEIVGNSIFLNSVDITYVGGGGIYLAEGTTASIRENLIYANFAAETGGAGGGVYCASVDAEIRDNTIVENGFAVIGMQPKQEGGLGAGLYLLNSMATVINNIIGTVNPGVPMAGDAVHCTGGDPFFAYNDVWNNDLFNDDPEYGGYCPDQTGLNGNISADPLFCGPLNRDYQLNCGSPCRGTGQGHTDIGALGVGCGTTRTAPATWGSIKVLYR